MTLAEAKRVARSFLGGLDVDSPGLNDLGVGGVALNGAQLYFEYRASAEQLQCSALVYKFSKLPVPAMVQSFQEEASRTDTGGGVVHYDPQSLGIYLARSYSTVPAVPAFRDEMEKLMAASVRWKEEAVEGIAARGRARAEGTEGKEPVSFFPDKKASRTGP